MAQATTRLWTTILLFVATVGSSSQPEQQRQDILHRAANYLSQYEQRISAVIAVEEYTQSLGSAKGVSDRNRTVRRLRSDLLIFADATGWVEFRDVYEVDGKPVRDRDDRLMRLFMEPASDPRTQASRIVDASATFNLDVPRLPFKRTLNVPMTALRFLRRENQGRSAFAIESIEDRGDRRIATVLFNEVAVPSLIGSNEIVRTRGAFRIDVESGRVQRSELEVAGETVVATIVVTFVHQPALDLWLPATMEETYRFRNTTVVGLDGRAKYSNYRQFKVDTSIAIKE